MPIEITTRHVEIDETIKTMTREKAERLTEKFPDIEFIHAVLDKDGPFFTAMIAVQGGHNGKTEGTGSKPGIIEAVQDAFEKAEAQLRKNEQRKRESR